MSKKIITSVQTEGFEAVLYPGDGRKDKVMIVMSGSDGGMTLTKQESEFYHKNGIPELALALFKTKQTPKELSCVPVEFVEKAIVWLKKQGYQQVGIDGTSKGSEMALVAASLFSDLSCVIVRVPSHFVSEGLTGSGKNKAPSGTSCWSYRGRELPYAPYRSRTFNILQMFMREKEMHIITFNRDKDITPETLIPIRDHVVPCVPLSLDKIAYCLVLDCFQFIAVYFSRCEVSSCFFQYGRTQETPYIIIAKRCVFFKHSDISLDLIYAVKSA